MHFVFADSSDIDLWDIDYLDTDLDLLDTDVPSKHFVCLQNILKTSSRRLVRCLQDALDNRKLLRWRRAEGVFKTCLEDQQMFAGWSSKS